MCWLSQPSELWEIYFCCSEVTSLWWCKKQWAKWAKRAALAAGLRHAGLGEARTAELWRVPEEDGNPNYQIKLSNFTLFVCLLCVYDEAGGAC